MSKAQLASLPVELLHHIARFMSADDVLACSQTCHYLRYAFNHDFVWETWLPSQDMSDLIEIQEQKLPFFKVPKSFSPLCNNRINYMRRTHLLKKWREEEQVQCSETFSFVIYNYWASYFDTRGEGQIIFKSKYIFLSTPTHQNYDEYTIQMWNIERVNKPYLYASLNTEGRRLSKFYIIGSCLVLIECDNVHVYLIDTMGKILTFVYSFMIIGEEVMINECAIHDGEHNSTCLGWSYSVKDQYLISHKFGDDVMHIWNISDSFKVGAFLLPESTRSFFITYHSENNSDWIIQQTLYRPGTNVRYYFIFNIERRSFSKKFFKYNGIAQHLIFFGSNVILFEFASDGYDTMCRMVDFATNNEIKRKRFNNSRMNSKIENTTVMNGKFVILCTDGFHVVNASNLETIKFVPNENSLFRYVFKEFHVFGTFFLLLSTSTDKCVVWDVNKCQSLFEIHEKDISRVYMDQLCTKIVFLFHTNFTVLHFW